MVWFCGIRQRTQNTKKQNTKKQNTKERTMVFTNLRLRSRATLVASALVVLGFGAPCASAALNADEAQMVAWIEARAPEVEALIETLVNINSGTLNHAGVRDVGSILERELASLSFRTEWIDLPAEMNRAGHLIARRGGDRGSKVLLIGHLDTVFESGDPFQTFVREGDWASGPGTDDMKSGNVIIVYALKALEAIGALDGAQLVVVYTGDEESPGRPLEVTRGALIEAGRWADVALGFEAGARAEGAEWVTVSRRSSSRWRLEVEGLQAHSSQIFSDAVGAGAIFEASRILSAFYESVRGEDYLTFNAGSILGGTDVAYDWEATEGRSFGKTNVVPRRVVVHGGIRTLTDEQLGRARSKMRAIVSASLPHTHATIAFDEGYPAMAPTAGNRRLARMLSEINVDLGREPMPELDPSRRGAADISFVAPYADSLDGLGAYGEGGHSPDERLDLTSLPVAIERAAILLYRLTR